MSGPEQVGEHQNLELLRRGMRAFHERDLVTLSELFAEHLVWHYMGTSVLAGDYHGIDEVFGLFARRAALTEESYVNTVEGAVANNSFVTVISRTEATREDGRKHSDRICVVYRVVTVDGVDKVVEAWTMVGNPEAEEAFYC